MSGRPGAIGASSRCWCTRRRAVWISRKRRTVGTKPTTACRATCWRSTHQAPLRPITPFSWNGMEARSSAQTRSEEHTSELQSRSDLVCRLLLEKKKNKVNVHTLNKITIHDILLIG